MPVAAKTGTSSARRDAWLAGTASSIVTVVWVGRDDGSPLGLTGAQAAAPIWNDFMKQALGLRRPVPEPASPRDIVRRWIDPDTGLLVRSGKRGAVEEVFRRRALPPKKWLWRPGQSDDVIR